MVYLTGAMAPGYGRGGYGPGYGRGYHMGWGGSYGPGYGRVTARCGSNIRESGPDDL